MTSSPSTSAIAELPIPLERDVFMRSVLRELSGTLQDLVGLDDAAGFISVVGQRIGDELGDTYRKALGVSELDRPQVAEVLIDLKRRIHGDFHVVSQDDERIVLANTRCPFGAKVIDRPSLCMMTSNVFGSIAADNLGSTPTKMMTLGPRALPRHQRHRTRLPTGGAGGGNRQRIGIARDWRYPLGRVIAG